MVHCASRQWSVLVGPSPTSGISLPRQRTDHKKTFIPSVAGQELILRKDAEKME